MPREMMYYDDNQDVYDTITLEEWRHRPVWERIEGWVAGVVRGQL